MTKKSTKYCSHRCANLADKARKKTQKQLLKQENAKEAMRQDLLHKNPELSSQIYIHHLSDNLYRVAGGLTQAKPDNGINTLEVTFVADIVTIETSCLAELTFTAYDAFHQDVLLKVLQRVFTYQTFFLHIA